LTMEERGRIVGMLAGGCTVPEVAKAYRRSDRCIRDLGTKYHQTGTTADKAWSRRPPVLLLHRKKIIHRKARAHPEIEYSKLAKHGTFVTPDGTPLRLPSCSTLYWCLKKHSLTNHPCKKRPKLNKGHALKRLQFCKQYRNFQWSRRTLEFWDECSVQKGAGNNQEWCFCFPWENWKLEMITTVGTGRKPAQMVWASVWLDECGRSRRSKLVIMDRDPHTKKKGYSSKGYMNALAKGLLPHY
jgi:hypothetical protein